MSHHAEALFCECDPAVLLLDDAIKVERGLLVHSDCARAVACEFEHGHRHAAARQVGEFFTCRAHERQADRAAASADDLIDEGDFEN